MPVPGDHLPKITTRSDSPVVRLAVTNDGMPSKQKRYPKALGPSPVIRLAHIHGAQGTNSLVGCNGVERIPENIWPALLVSFFYIKGWLNNQDRYAYRDWALDSGAFSAKASGNPINLNEFTECCLRLMETDKTLTDIFALDVIPPENATPVERARAAEQGVKNTEKMWAQGVPAIPCFHYGEPWEVLLHLAKTYPKIALGGTVGQKVAPRDRWIAQCFARVWPKPIHGFGFVNEKTVMSFPFHSIDATSWETGPCRFGYWRGMGVHRAMISVRGNDQNLRGEVEYYLDLEDRARQRWKKEMKLLEVESPQTVRLVVGTGRSIRPEHLTRIFKK